MSLRIKPQLETGLYINQEGYIYIWQTGPRGEDYSIILGPDQTKEFYKELKRLAPIQRDIWNHESVENHDDKDE